MRADTQHNCPMTLHGAGQPLTQYMLLHFCLLMVPVSGPVPLVCADLGHL